MEEAFVKKIHIIKELETLKKKYDFDISHNIDGDTHGISSYQYISIKIKEYDIEFIIED